MNLEQFERLKEEFRLAIEEYNEALRAGKVRAIQKAAVTAHQVLFSLSQSIRTSHPDEQTLQSEIEAALAEVRLGRPIT